MLFSLYCCWLKMISSQCFPRPPVPHHHRSLFKCMSVMHSCATKAWKCEGSLTEADGYSGSFSFTHTSNLMLMFFWKSTDTPSTIMAHPMSYLRGNKKCLTCEFKEQTGFHSYDAVEDVALLHCPQCFGQCECESLQVVIMVTIQFRQRMLLSNTVHTWYLWTICEAKSTLFSVVLGCFIFCRIKKLIHIIITYKSNF